MRYYYPSSKVPSSGRFKIIIDIIRASGLAWGFLHMMHQDVFCLAIFRNTNTDESFGNLAILSGG